MENIIIGAGTYGLSIALALLEAGEEVTIIDGDHPSTASINALGRLDPILRGAGSVANLSTDGTKKLMLKPDNQKKIALDSYDRHKANYEKLVNCSSIDYELEEIPTLQIFFNEEDFVEIANSIEEVESLGFNISLLGSHKEIEHYQEGVSKEVFGAALVSGTLFLDSRLFISSLRRTVEVNGGIFINNLLEKVFVKEKEISTASGPRLSYENLIICAGPWTNNVISSIGKTIDLYPAKGEILKVSSEGINLKNHLHGPCSMVKKRDGLIWIAATYKDGIFDANPSKEAELELISSASKMFPEIINQKIIDHTACIRPATKDDMPRIGEIITDSKIFVATGGGGWGIMQSFYIGEVVKDLVLGQNFSLTNI